VVGKKFQQNPCNWKSNTSRRYILSCGCP